MKLRSRSGSRQVESMLIRVRAPLELRELIDRAAALVGQSRTEFILTAPAVALKACSSTRPLFVLDEARHATFTSILDQPLRPTPVLRRLMRTKAPWER
jgi:uncharacterized protein (DUF1778 family)